MSAASASGRKQAFGNSYPSLRQPSLGTLPMAIGTKSSCGNQVKSTVVSHPSYGFGTASRDIAAKKFISHEHTAKSSNTGFVPGPGAYESITTTGDKSAISTVKKVQAFTMGKEVRFSAQIRDGIRTGSVPGPGAYVI